VVPLEAVTVKVTLPRIWTVWLKGWTVMTGGGVAEQGLGSSSKAGKSKQIAACFNRRLNVTMFRMPNVQ
jgi:hypothetical protein